MLFRLFYPRSRPLLPTEVAALPPRVRGLADDERVRLVDGAHPLAFVGKLMGMGDIILVRGQRIFWPNLPEDISVAASDVAVLAHELCHVWQYKNGMSAWSYVWRERGVYAYKLLKNKPFLSYGYEQQAAIVEDSVRLYYGLKPRHALEAVEIGDLDVVMGVF